MVEPYVPNDLLSRLVGDRMYSVEFVLNDYVQFRFDGSAQGERPVTRSLSRSLRSEAGAMAHGWCGVQAKTALKTFASPDAGRHVLFALIDAGRR